MPFLLTLNGFIPYSGVSSNDFEQGNARWVIFSSLTFLSLGFYVLNSFILFLYRVLVDLD